MRFSTPSFTNMRSRHFFTVHNFSGGKAVLDGFTVGATIWGRVRKIGTGGEVGDWSDPAQFLVH